MKANFRFNTAEIAKIEAGLLPKRGQVEYADPDHRGLYIRVSRSSKTWYLLYSHKGQQLRVRLGRFPEMNVIEARRAAAKNKGAVADGADPAAEVAAHKAAESFAEVAAQYLDEHASKNRKRSRDEDARIIRHDLLPEWHQRRMADITRGDIKALLRGVVKRDAPVMADRIRSLVSSMFWFALDEEIIKYNPAQRLKKLGPRSKRKRFLSEDELRRLFVELEREPVRRRALVRMALLTGARRGELTGLPWTEIDGDVWALPAARAKNNLDHRIPLLASVRAMFEALPHESDFVFHSGANRLRHEVGSATRTWLWFPQLCKRAGIEDLTFHDLRRTVSTYLNDHQLCGKTPHIVERILTHVQGGVVGIYNQHEYAREKRAALEKWERRLNRIISGEAASAKVVSLAGRR